LAFFNEGNRLTANANKSTPTCVPILRSKPTITENKKHCADNTIVCSGAWSSSLLDIKDPIYPIKGQMIVIKAKVGVVEHIILDQGRYIIPRKDGRLLIGSTMENEFKNIGF
jgi:glycine/D-amino acid oxidase-like deaminating enzyme